MSESYLVFDQLPDHPKRKTRIWMVNSTSGSFLGEVRWYGPWRAYCFFPDAGTIYNAGCLDDITRFCRSKTSEHMTARRRVSETVSD